MKIKLLGLAAVLASSLVMTGCGNTAEGVAQDASQAGNTVANAGEVVANGAATAVNEASQAVANTGEAVANGAATAVNEASQAVANTGEAAANVASQAANGVANAGQAVANGASAAVNGVANAASAAPVTAKVKLAIQANKDLNDSANTINVDTKDGQVVLRGNVATAALKKTAETIATKVIKDNGYSEKVTNQLTIGGKS